MDKARDTRDDLRYWLNDAAAILQSNGTTTHADKVRLAADMLKAGAVLTPPEAVRDAAEALELFTSYGCPVCHGDCASANPPVSLCPMQAARKALASLRSRVPTPAPDAVHTIAHDGFTGSVVGHYTTREGKRGVVLQQIGTRVVHVYGEKWLAPPLPLESDNAAKEENNNG